MSATIEIRGLAHAYGANTVLDGLDWRVEGPGVFGFLGVNGSGKTTSIRILTGFLHPDAGLVRVLGRAPEDPALRRLSSVLLQAPDFYPYLSAEEHLVLLGELYGHSRAEARREAATLLDRLELGPSAKKRAGTLSGGMRQRLGLAAALIGGPELVILDEPVSSLDPLGRKLALDLIVEVGRSRTVLFSTHVLSDAERRCDEVAILHAGRIQACGPPARLVAERAAPTIELEVAGDGRALAEDLRAAPGFLKVEGEGSRLRVEVDELEAAQRVIPRLVAERGLGLVSLSAARPDLERAFLRVTGRDAGDRP